ncbi:TIGR03085 family metal-binding protein [Staphylococcus chromogenes]|nr:TIGR03085 family metal-binding protein [Staphylococcus chromogenes]
MSFATRERASLKLLLSEVGPDHPTCCAGWHTKDLAVHLYVREHRPLAAAGMFVSGLQSQLDVATREVMSWDYADVVEKWGSGPPLAWKPLDSVVNRAENFIHHEDVRRAGEFSQRTFSKDSQRQMYTALKVARGMLSKSPARVLLRPAGDVSFDVIEAGTRSANKTLVVSGPVSELLLWVFGRPAVGLDFFGDQEAVVRASL